LPHTDHGLQAEMRKLVIRSRIIRLNFFTDAAMHYWQAEKIRFIGLTIVFILALSTFSMGYTRAFGQTVPPLPASNQNDDSIATKISKIVNDILNRDPEPVGEMQQVNDDTRPVIEVLTGNLTEGKNVIFVRITDESRIDHKFVKYVSDGRIVYGDLVKSENSQYKSLVNVKAPNALIIFNAIDEYGNKAVMKKTFVVEPSKGWFEKTAKWLQDFMPFV
jgi:hypothetical protein